MTDRAIVFIDGNNWYHSLRDAGVQDLGHLDYSKISRKLLGPRDWIETRYYIGRVKQSGNPQLYADQRRFLASLKATDSRITTHLGRLEPRPADDPAARELTDYLNALKIRIDKSVFHDLHRIARRHRTATIMVEKAVDVMIAVDIVSMALRNEYDAAYLLSADGDFTPAVKEARTTSKKVYAASPAAGAELSASVDTFIRLDRWWFDDCFR